MNIKNCAALPVKTHQEKTTENAQNLRLQFPVSSGQSHRKTENDWVPVSPKKSDEMKAIMPAPVAEEEDTASSSSAAAATEATSVATSASPTEAPTGATTGTTTVETTVAVVAATDSRSPSPPLPSAAPEPLSYASIPLPTHLHLPPLPPAIQGEGSWDESGLFTGTTGARVLSQAELSAGQQAWAKKREKSRWVPLPSTGAVLGSPVFASSSGGSSARHQNYYDVRLIGAGEKDFLLSPALPLVTSMSFDDQLICAQPVSGGMGMSLLQKMGWKPGEGLGKRNEGTLEPLKLHVKMDKRGLVCAEELPQQKFKPQAKAQPVKSLEGKHPVSLLVEYCTRKHLNPPVFTVLTEDGPAHKKSFVFKVLVNGVEYQPASSSPNKKLAKSEAAVMCLRILGLLPTV